MKNRTFLLMAVIAVLAVTVISCTPAGELTDYGYQNRPVYNAAPYGNNVIVVERDPYTGRYYQVNPNGVYLNDPYYNNYPYNAGRYGYGYNDRYNRSYGSGRRNDSRVYNNTNTNSNVNQQPSEDERQRAKEKVFGKRN